MSKKSQKRVFDENDDVEEIESNRAIHNFQLKYSKPVNELDFSDFALDTNLSNYFTPNIYMQDSHSGFMQKPIDSTDIVQRKSSSFQPFFFHQQKEKETKKSKQKNLIHRLITIPDETQHSDDAVYSKNIFKKQTMQKDDASDDQISQKGSDDDNDDNLDFSEDSEDERLMLNVPLSLENQEPFYVNDPTYFKKKTEKYEIEKGDEMTISRDAPRQMSLFIHTQKVFDEIPSYMYDDAYLSSDNEYNQQHRNAKNQLQFISDSQKPLQNCCVVSDNYREFQPMFTIFNQSNQKPKIHWMSFPGFHMSPFEIPPIGIDEYLKKEKKIISSKKKAVTEEAIHVNYCDICKVKYENATQHRASEYHKKNVESFNWENLDSFIDQINSKFDKN